MNLFWEEKGGAASDGSLSLIGRPVEKWYDFTEREAIIRVEIS